ncbi:MAG TPA: hypothetical protein VN673_03575, partial [Clostridia bacterium]|nr:hypothetical protein [Clostridia bacterium]
MTARGKIVLTLIVLAVAGFGAWRWWDKIAPKSRSEVRSVNVDEVRKAVQAARETPADIPLLIGTNTANLVQRSGIPSVTGVSDYSKAMKDGKLIVEFPINI